MTKTINIEKKLSALAAIFALLPAPPPHTVRAQTSIHLNEVSRETIETRLRSFSRKDSEREQILKAAFQEVGCRDEHLSEQPVKRAKLPNLICVLPGSADSEIIVGAHFDHTSEGNGIVDNWTGAAMLASLYKALNAGGRKHTFVFIAFSGEEDGLYGSSFYAKELSSGQTGRIRVMINLDSLGTGPASAWVHQSDIHFTDALHNIANTMNLPFGMHLAVDNAGDNDSYPFSKRYIPTVTFHSVTEQTLSILHSKRDDLSAINVADYYDSYRLISAYLAYLDSTLN